ncbi:MAG TPA: DUF6498-containing protein [Methylomirabilota bacterium]|nr:DUF6498-containing protein [Methylomirabilota bacterium]
MERLVAWYRLASSSGAVVALIVANAIPLFGALFLGWNVWTILIVYWLENGIVGVFNVLKILRAEGPMDPTMRFQMNGRPMAAVGRGAVAGFFVIHYGLFWFVHGIFVLTLPLFAGMGNAVQDFGPSPLDGQFPGAGQFPGEGLEAGGFSPFTPATDMVAGFDIGPVILAVVALAISHGVSYWFNYIGRAEYRRTSAAAQMFAPYGRLVVLHITIILGGMAIALTGAPAAALAILVALKIAMDAGFHLAEHRKRALPPGTVPTA